MQRGLSSITPKHAAAGGGRISFVAPTAQNITTVRRIIGSILFALWLLVSTPPFSLLAVLSSPLPPLWRYRIIGQWSRLAVRAATLLCGIQYQVKGKHNLPSAPCVLLSRHESAWETIAYQTIFPPQSIVLKKELLYIPFFGWGLAQMSPIAINRDNGRQALRDIGKQGKKRLSNGFYIIIFPEGTRLSPDERRPYQPGGAWLAKHAGVAAVPVAVDSGRCWRKNSFFKNAGLITVQIGTPIDTKNLSVLEINAKAKEWIESCK